MKAKLILIICFCWFSSNAQQTTDKPKNTGLSMVEFAKAKELFLTMYQSETYQIKVKIEKEVIGKIVVGIPVEYTKENDWKDWLIKNLKNTKFKDINEAVKLREKNLELVKKVVGENEELFELMTRASQKQIFIITKPERVN